MSLQIICSLLYLSACHCASCVGSQAARTVTIVAGSVGGSLALLLVAAIVSIIACLVVKQRGYNLSTDVEHSDSNKEFNIVTETNTAYKSVKQVPTIELEGLYIDTSSPGEGTTKLQLSTENQDYELNMEENVAYGSSTAASLNVTYDYISNKSRPRKTLDEGGHSDNQYIT